MMSEEEDKEVMDRWWRRIHGGDSWKSYITEGGVFGPVLDPILSYKTRVRVIHVLSPSIKVNSTRVYHKMWARNAQRFYMEANNVSLRR